MKRLIFLFIFINILCLRGYGQAPNVDTLGPGVDTTFFVKDTFYTNIIFPYSGDTIQVIGGRINKADTLGIYSANEYLLKASVKDSIAAHLKDSLYARLVNGLRDSINIAIAESLINHYKKADIRSLISDSIQTKDAITEISGALDSLATKATITNLNLKANTLAMAESLATKMLMSAFKDSISTPIIDTIFVQDNTYKIYRDDPYLIYDRNGTPDTLNVSGGGGGEVTLAQLADSLATKLLRSAFGDSINQVKNWIKDSVATHDQITEISGALDSLATKATVTNLNLKANTTVMVESLATKATTTQLNLKLGISAASDTFLRKSALGDSTYNKAKILSIVTDSIKTVKNAVDIWFDAMLFVPDTFDMALGYKTSISYFMSKTSNYYFGYKIWTDTTTTQEIMLWKTIEIPNDFISWDTDSAFTAYFYASQPSTSDSSDFFIAFYNPENKVGGGSFWSYNASTWLMMPSSSYNIITTAGITVKPKDFFTIRMYYAGKDGGYILFRGIRMRYNRR